MHKIKQTNKLGLCTRNEQKNEEEREQNTFGGEEWLLPLLSAQVESSDLASFFLCANKKDIRSTVLTMESDRGRMF